MPGGGPHPKDRDLFAAEHLEALRLATAELSYLRERGYALPGALKLVGDRHQLRERQRVAIKRATSEAGGAVARAARRAGKGAAPPDALGIDGFNVVITLETALNGGVLVSTLDGGLRDLAGVHGNYRVSATTDDAIAIAAGRLTERGWQGVPTCWYLDAPVSNSGRLAARLRAHGAAAGLPWTVEVVPDPDLVLAVLPAGSLAASSDAVILDRCPGWIDLAGEAIRARIPQAWIIELISV